MFTIKFKGGLCMENESVSSVLLDETRRKIVDVLKNGEKSAGELADICGISNSNLSHHLNVLKKHHFVEERKDGRYVYYSLKKLDIYKSKNDVFHPIVMLAKQKKCEAGLQPDSHDSDKGIFSIFYQNDCLIEMEYSFTPFDSFVYHFEKPFKNNDSLVSMDENSLMNFHSFVHFLFSSLVPNEIEEAFPSTFE